MSLLTLPNELILLVADGFSPKELNSLLKVNRHLAALLTKHLHTLAFKDHDGLPALHWAAKHGHESLVKLLLNSGFDVASQHDTVLGEGTTALHLAAHSGELGVAKLLLQAGADVNTLNGMGRTPLFFAAMHAQEPVARLLLENGAIDIRAKDGSTAFTSAVCHNLQAVVLLLLEKGIDVNAHGRNQESILHLAIAYGLEPMVQLLLDNGVDIEARNNRQSTAIHWAIDHLREPILKLLLARGADPNVQNERGETPLHRAALWGYDAGAAALLEKADVTIRNTSEITAIQVAIWRGSQTVARLILAKGIENDTLDIANGVPALHYAAENGWEDLGRRLLEKGVDVNATCVKGKTALMLAANLGDEAVVKTLLAYGADTTLKDYKGRTAFYHAVNTDHEPVVRLLAETADIDEDVFSRHVLHSAASHGSTNIINLVMDQHPRINVDYRDDNGDTMLHRAVRDLVFPQVMVGLLLSKGANVNALDNTGSTPLHWAAQHGATDACQILLRNGADIALTSLEGYTALQVASKNAHKAVTALLMEAQDRLDTSAGS